MTKSLNVVLEEYSKNPEWQEYLVGADFCGVPWEGDIKKFADLFQVCRDKDIKLTIHTAELECHAYETKDILYFKPERVGHYVYATDEEIDTLKSYGGLVEICPTSNIITGEMEHLGLHPVAKFVEKDVKFSICTDDLLLFDKNVSEEIYYISEAHPEIFDLDRIQKCQVDAIECSFLKDDVLKQKILKEINDGFDAARKNL